MRFAPTYKLLKVPFSSRISSVVCICRDLFDDRTNDNPKMEKNFKIEKGVKNETKLLP